MDKSYCSTSANYNEMIVIYCLRNLQFVRQKKIVIEINYYAKKENNNNNNK